jgi:hypothetical protein
MSRAGRDLLVAGTILTSVIAGAQGAAAQQVPPPNPPRSDITGQPNPSQDQRSTGAVGSSPQSLSDKLESTGGVIRPPSEIAPDMTVPAPAPNPGTTPVIPPPGSPGGDPTIQPK